MAADYDISSIQINPHEVAARADKLIGLTTDVAALIKKIADTIFDLKLGWVGKTADEAKQFSDKWTAVMKELFGTDDKNDTNPSDAGVLNIMSNGLKAVAQGFDEVEAELAKSFAQMYGSLFESGTSGETQATPTSTPASSHDPTKSAVSETFGWEETR